MVFDVAICMLGKSQAQHNRTGNCVSPTRSVSESVAVHTCWEVLPKATSRPAYELYENMLRCIPRLSFGERLQSDSRACIARKYNFNLKFLGIENKLLVLCSDLKKKVSAGQRESTVRLLEK
eukprot:629571-Prorocentrum_minimum.AAC.3